MIVRFIDTHAHLDSHQFDPDREAVIQRALDAGIQAITVGTDLESSVKAIKIAQRYGLYAAVGIHPHEAERFVRGDQLDPQALAQLEELLKEERVVAVGEIGLDYFKEYSPRSAQQIVLEAQLELAQRCHRPVVLHNRDSEHDLLRILCDYDVEGVLHSFTGDRALAEQALELGLYLGVNGIVTFTKSVKLQEAVRAIPIERLLLETDAPFLAPVPQRGRRNEPLYVRHVADYVTQLLNLPLERLARVTTENAQQLFSKSAS